jgi:molybdopterin synthase sulfur carrier subunit
MMLKILYFAGLRERLGQGSEELALPAGVADVAACATCWPRVAAPGKAWRRCRNLRYAVNQQMARPRLAPAGG